GGESEHDRRTRRPVLHGKSATPEREDGEKLSFETEKDGQSSICLRIVEKLKSPAELHQHRASRGKDNEIIPTLAKSDGGDANVQDCDVAEERGRIIDTGRKQDRREKSTQ